MNAIAHLDPAPRSAFRLASRPGDLSGRVVRGGPEAADPEAADPGGAAPDLGRALAPGRAHEACGPARRVFAAMLAAATEGPVLWILPDWSEERLNPDGLTTFFDPARLVLARIRRAEDLLWTAEEALRSGACPLVVVETPPTQNPPPALTPVRRLHLAAEAGAAASGGAGPRALLLTPGDGGAQGVETRWRMAPAPGRAREGTSAAASGPSRAARPKPPSPVSSPDRGPRWRLELVRARAARPRSWAAGWSAGGCAGGRLVAFPTEAAKSASSAPGAPIHPRLSQALPPPAIRPRAANAPA